MPVITIEGPMGSGASTIGQFVAEKLEINFVDRLVLTEAAKLVRAPVGALIAKEQRTVRFRGRLNSFIQAMLEGSAINADMYSGAGLAGLAPESLAAVASADTKKATKVTDEDFIKATTTVVKDLYRAGNVVIIGRGANVILADAPGVFHVGLLASLEVRTETLMASEHLEREAAEVYVEELEQARVKYFRKFFQVHPNEPTLYHTLLNRDKMQLQAAVDIIVQSAEDLTWARRHQRDLTGASDTEFQGWGEQGKQ